MRCNCTLIYHGEKKLQADFKMINNEEIELIMFRTHHFQKNFNSCLQKWSIE